MLFVVLLLIVASLGHAKGEQHYIAAVYQHAIYEALHGREPMDVWKHNLDVYEEQAIIAGEKKADIILFPEGGLTGMFAGAMTDKEKSVHFTSECPDPDIENWTPCDHPERHRAYPLQRLSCMAKQNKIYIVAALYTTHVCTGQPKCPPEGRFTHNTAVVFDRTGKLILRYHKTHLFFEVGTNSAQKPQIPIFDTDFGGRFGVCICFDSLFKFPIVETIQRAGIKNILFPTYWVDQFLPAVIWQQQFAAGNDVNFLASNPIDDLTFGSSIFSGEDALAVAHAKPELLIAKVPVNGPKRSDEDHRCHGCVNQNDDPTAKYKLRPEAEDTFWDGMMKFTPLVSNQDTLTLCDNDLCCSLSYKIRNNPNDELYVFGIASRHLVINEQLFKPESKVDLEHKLFLQVCTLLKCPGKDRESCGPYPSDAPATTTFDNFDIKGNFSSYSLYPAVVHPGHTFPHSDEWHHCHDCGRLWSENGLERPLLMAALRGRAYERDDLDPRQQ